ncbi:MAG: site-2 protease family protein [Desulfuromonadales bacterium]|nr:site-2 protease family protein [Desulfuromonadales bacterium]
MESILAKIAVMLVPAFFAVTVHEVAHGYMADKFGDPTGRLLGRLTFNPLKHFDFLGTISLLVFGFGWARPVPVNFGNMKNPYWGRLAVTLAGPVSNFLLALLFAVSLHLLAAIPEQTFLGVGAAVVEPFRLMLAFGLYVNIIIGLLNLLPIPPLDGGMILISLLPEKQAALVARLEPFGYVFFVMIAYYTGFWRIVLAPAVFYVASFISVGQSAAIEQIMTFPLSR